MLPSFRPGISDDIISVFRIKLILLGFGCSELLLPIDGNKTRKGFLFTISKN